MFLGLLPSLIFPDSGVEGCLDPPGAQMGKVRHSRLAPSNLVLGCWALLDDNDMIMGVTAKSSAAGN